MAEAEQRLAATALEVLGPTLEHADRRRRGRVLARDVPVLARRERLRRHAADPAQHHRRPRPRPATGVAEWISSSATSRRWLGESVETLLDRDEPTRRPWAGLVEFGALSVGGDDGLGAVELCLIARALGAHLAPVPYLGSAAVRFAAGGGPRRRRRRARGARAGRELGEPRPALRPSPAATPSPAARWPSSTPARSRVSPSSRPRRGRPGARHRRRRRGRRQLVPQPAFDADRADVRGRARRRPGAAGPLGGDAPPAGDDRGAARRRRGGRRGGPHARRRVRATPPSGASSAARSAASRRCATCWPTCTCARRAPGPPSSTRRPRSTRTPTRRRGPCRSPRRTCRARRARSRTARCRCSAASPSPPSIPPTGTCAGSSCASGSSAMRPITSGRSGERSRRPPSLEPVT